MEYGNADQLVPLEQAIIVAAAERAALLAQVVMLVEDALALLFGDLFDTIISSVQ